MSSGYSLRKWHHGTRQEVFGPHAVLFPGWPSPKCLLVLGLWVSPSDPIAAFTDVICPSYYCWITHHPKLSGVKWQILYYTHRFHELRIWKWHNRNGLSLLRDIWDLWENSVSNLKTGVRNHKKPFSFSFILKMKWFMLGPQLGLSEDAAKYSLVWLLVFLIAWWLVV